MAEVDELAVLSVADLEQRFREVEVRRRRVEAESALILARLEEARSYRRDGHASMFGFLRSAPHWSEAECRSRSRLSRLLAAYPNVAELLWDGQLSVANADAIAKLFANRRLGERFESVLGTLLHEAQRMEHDDFRRIPARWELLHDPARRGERGEVHAGRDAHMSIVDGKGRLVAEWGDYDSARNAEIFDRFIDAEFEADWAAAKAQYGDAVSAALLPRTNAQRRADALSMIFEKAASVPADARPPEPLAVMHVDVHTATEILTRAGLFPERNVDPFDDPTPLISELRCETGDGELINPDEVLKVLLEGYVRFVIHNDKGIPIRWGRKRRLFKGAAKDAVISLSPRCIHAGCRVGHGEPKQATSSPTHAAAEPTPTTAGPSARATTSTTKPTAGDSNATATAIGTPAAPTAPKCPDAEGLEGLQRSWWSAASEGCEEHTGQDGRARFGR